MLSVEGLAVEIDGKVILRETVLSVEKGEILAILGRSGSGKSTMLKAIAGLVEPKSGSIFVDNDLVKKPSQQLIAGHKDIKIVRQDNPLFPNISLKENITYALRFYEKSYIQSRVSKLLKLTGLLHVADQLPKNVSEGEQQRAVIATALAEEPKVLLLDEPFSNLDYANKAKLKGEIRFIVSSEKMACIFVTHDIDDVFGNADKLSVLKSGKIVQTGVPQKVYQAPKSKYVASITGHINRHIASDFESGDGFIYTRPQDVTISRKGQFIGQVREVTFRGNFWEIVLCFKGSVFSVFQMSEESIGSDVKFDIKSYYSF